jgi:hypothetical protein
VNCRSIFSNASAFLAFSGTNNGSTSLFSRAYQSIPSKNGWSLIVYTPFDPNLRCGFLLRRPFNKSFAAGENHWTITTSFFVIRRS